MEIPQPGTAVSGVVVTTPNVLRMAVAAYLARFKGQSRIHTDSDLRSYLNWCESRGLDPLAAARPHIELYVRWLQEVRQYRPSTVSRRMSVVAGFYRTCVIDAVLQHSPAEYVRRPNVPTESPTLGLTHLQFEALLSTAKQSTNPCTSHSSPCSVCWVCASSRPQAATLRTLARSTATACCACAARGTRSSSSRSRAPWDEPSSELSTTGRPVRSF
jgi:integrase